MKELLIVEDDQMLCHGIAIALKSNDMNITQVHTILDASKKLDTFHIHLIILDVNLPDGSGLEFLKELRLKSSVPVILLTANDMETDIVTGLELGADDYITKPFSLAVLRARVNTQLRKSVGHPKEEIVIDDFTFGFHQMEFWKGKQMIELSKTEQKLLCILVENRGKTVPRANLVDHIWTDAAEYVDENALSVTIKRLRDKLEEIPATPQYIKTVYGIGYTWVVK